jgi:hypothetical protein
MSGFDELDEGALHGYSTGAANERGERFVVEQRGHEWVAQFRVPNPLAGEVVPVGDAAATLLDKAVSLGMPGRDRRVAMLRLAELVAAE